MPTLSELEIQRIKEHMLHEEAALKRRFKTKKNQFDTIKVPHSEVNQYEREGWFVETRNKTKTCLKKKKPHFRQFEDDIWCMFYNLGFRILNADDLLRIPWGNYEGESKQIDVVAVGNDAIFVVECKSAEVPKKQTFQKELAEICQYKSGIAETLRQIYGTNKRVKFIFATRNYRIDGDCEDALRMRNNNIYHLDENGYNYISNLIKSYKESVKYQFHGMMFKDELISDKTITIPALRGKMGDKEYYLFSIEPSTLLKIGFVLHRTKVNDSMAPTYQRLLVPSRLKGITKFINDGGFFPNSIIMNFAEPNEQIKLSFDLIHQEEGSASQFGLLHIPDAYGIAYIIDGQHRVYGYANSDQKDKHTIPVVAFQNMPSEEQLQIFMDINENQKAVSKNLRIDLEEDLFWTSSRLDSRMKALRSSTIKMLSAQSSNILFNKISIGEDQAELSSVAFDKALLQSGLIPKAKQTKWIGNTDTCLYDVNETNIDKAMQEGRKRIVQYINSCYETAENIMEETKKATFLYSNRATFPFITLAGLLHTFLFDCGEISKESTIKERIEKITPYIKTLCEGINNLPEEEMMLLKGIQGQGAETRWLRSYQNIINKEYPEYNPEELQKWKETQDKKLQADGEKRKEDIRELVKELFFSTLKLTFGLNYENNIAKLEHNCRGRIIEEHSREEGFKLDDYDWKDYIKMIEIKDCIDQNFAHNEFSETFGIALSDKATSKKDKLSWFSMIEPANGKKNSGLTRSDINKLGVIYTTLNNKRSQDL